MGESPLTAAEKEFIIQMLRQVKLSGDAAALRQALSLIDSIIHKLSPQEDEEVS